MTFTLACNTSDVMREMTGGVFGLNIDSAPPVVDSNVTGILLVVETEEAELLVLMLCALAILIDAGYP